jgi:osmotically-inducible protein OsmY
MLQIAQATILSVFILLMTACSTPPKTESMGEFFDSSATTAKVKANLVDGLGAQGLAIQVKTYKDAVQLSGFVNSAIIKRHAGIVAAHTEGVARVRNDLIIK